RNIGSQFLRLVSLRDPVLHESIGQGPVYIPHGLIDITVIFREHDHILDMSTWAYGSTHVVYFAIIPVGRLFGSSRETAERGTQSRSGGWTLDAQAGVGVDDAGSPRRLCSGTE